MLLNDEPIDNGSYANYHRRRIDWTLAQLRKMGGKKIVEVGGHPWAMTEQLIDSAAFELCATVSAEEVTHWPDDVGVTVKDYHIKTAKGTTAIFQNYSANVERTRFQLRQQPDTVIACEIIEHLIRSPHTMMLNMNAWLPISGKILLTTPNGAQFSNPLHVKSQTPAYRSYAYERHSYLYTLDGLTDLIALCGFKILEADYWDAVERTGPSKLYTVLGTVPLQYFKIKFKKTLYVIAEKTNDVSELERSPQVYEPSGNWESIRRSEPSSGWADWDFKN